MSVPFTINKQPGSGATVRLEVTGEVDMSTSGALDEIIANAIVHDHPPELIIDLDGVTFLDSTGISALLAGRNLATDHGTTLRIENPRGTVHRTLTATGLLDLLTHPDEGH